MIRKVAQLLLAPDAASGGGTAIAPNPTPTPTPAPKPSSPPPGPAPAPNGDDPFSKLDARTAAKPKAEPDKEPAKAPDKTVDAKSKADRTFTEPKQLRAAFDATAKERDTLKTELDGLRSKLSQAEEGTKKAADLAARIAAVEKERDELKGELSQAKFKPSDNFTTNFDKPFNQAAEYAKRVVNTLSVATFDANGDATGERPAKYETDFAELYALPLSKAAKAARAMFGEDAQIVIDQLTSLQRLDYLRKQAFSDEQTAFETSSKQRQEAELGNQTKQQEATEAMWRTVNQDVSDRHPDWAPDPKDKEQNDILHEAFDVVDTYFSTAAKDMPMQSRIVLAANIRHRAATQPLFVHRLNQANSQIAELKQTIEELKGSGPGRTARPTSGGDGGSASADSWEADLRKNVPETPGG